tara:strand:+ start:2777 stop:2878 length:102 start_codon:yes stop_codon:yes gene_type:complete
MNIIFMKNNFGFKRLIKPLKKKTKFSILCGVAE